MVPPRIATSILSGMVFLLLIMGMTMARPVAMQIRQVLRHI